MTYSCTNPDDLHELASKVEEIITTLKGKLPKSEGLILRPEARKRARQRAKKICRKYRPIPKSVKRGRHRNDWRYQNRVGRKANELRKVSYGISDQLQRCKPLEYLRSPLTGNNNNCIKISDFTVTFADITPRNWRDPGSPNPKGEEDKRAPTGIKLPLYRPVLFLAYI